MKDKFRKVGNIVLLTLFYYLLFYSVLLAVGWLMGMENPNPFLNYGNNHDDWFVGIIIMLFELLVLLILLLVLAFLKKHPLHVTAITLFLLTWWFSFFGVKVMVDEIRHKRWMARNEKSRVEGRIKCRAFERRIFRVLDKKDFTLIGGDIEPCISIYERSNGEKLDFAMGTDSLTGQASVHLDSLKMAQPLSYYKCEECSDSLIKILEKYVIPLQAGLPDEKQKLKHMLRQNRCYVYRDELLTGCNFNPDNIADSFHTGIGYRAMPHRSTNNKAVCRLSFNCYFK